MNFIKGLIVLITALVSGGIILLGAAVLLLTIYVFVKSALAVF